MRQETQYAMLFITINVSMMVLYVKKAEVEPYGTEVSQVPSLKVVASTLIIQLNHFLNKKEYLCQKTNTTNNQEIVSRKVMINQGQERYDKANDVKVKLDLQNDPCLYIKEIYQLFDSFFLIKFFVFCVKLIDQ